MKTLGALSGYLFHSRYPHQNVGEADFIHAALSILRTPQLGSWLVPIVLTKVLIRANVLLTAASIVVLSPLACVEVLGASTVVVDIAGQHALRFLDGFSLR